MMHIPQEMLSHLVLIKFNTANAIINVTVLVVPTHLMVHIPLSSLARQPLCYVGASDAELVEIFNFLEEAKVIVWIQFSMSLK